MHRVLEYKIKNIVYCWLRKEVDKYCTYCTSRLSVSLAFCNAFFFVQITCMLMWSQPNCIIVKRPENKKYLH